MPSTWPGRGQWEWGAHGEQQTLTREFALLSEQPTSSTTRGCVFTFRVFFFFSSLLINRERYVSCLFFYFLFFFLLRRQLIVLFRQSIWGGVMRGHAPCFPGSVSGALPGKVILSRFGRGHLCVCVCVCVPGVCV